MEIGLREQSETRSKLYFIIGYKLDIYHYKIFNINQS